MEKDNIMLDFTRKVMGKCEIQCWMSPLYLISLFFQCVMSITLRKEQVLIQRGILEKMLRPN